MDEGEELGDIGMRRQAGGPAAGLAEAEAAGGEGGVADDQRLRPEEFGRPGPAEMRDAAAGLVHGGAARSGGDRRQVWRRAALGRSA